MTPQVQARRRHLAAHSCTVALILGLATLAGLLRPDRAAAQIEAPRYSSPRYSSIVIDVASGRVLSATAPDELRYPASLTKMMTLYMVFEALRDRRITLDQLVPISVHAASVEPSKLGLAPGGRMTVQEGILGLVTKSANDAAAALGELLGGDEPRFAQMMTLRARALGMTNTTFRNASGLPDPYQVSSARDLALLARHLIQDFPADYAYFSVPSFQFHRQTIYNHDRMLITYPGADGLKTGYTEAAGHNLVTSAVHGPVRLVGVVLGAPSNPERDIQMAALLNAGFTEENAPDIGPDLTARTRLAVARGLIARLPNLVSTAEAAPLPARLRRHSPITLAAYTVPSWSVQLGSFGSTAAAQRAAAAAEHAAAGAAVKVIPAGAKHKPLWRVQLTGMTERQAHAACAATKHHAACTLIRPNAQLASR
jgi:D-alanyl-D-alanine carboxypeptidase